MKVLTGFVLYLLGAFILVALGLTNVLPVDYLGGIVIGLYIVALIYAFTNAIRSGEKLIAQEKTKNRLEYENELRLEESQTPVNENSEKKEEIKVAA